MQNYSLIFDARFHDVSSHHAFMLNAVAFQYSINVYTTEGYHWYKVKG